MSDTPNRFNSTTADLGTYSSHDDPNALGTEFQQLYLASPYIAKCAVCTQPPLYRLIPKATSGITIANPDDALVCRHCLQMFSKDLYGIRELDNRRNGGLL